MAASAATGVDVRPYAPSWLHTAVAWLERLPGPTWIAYLALFLAEHPVLAPDPVVVGDGTGRDD